MDAVCPIREQAPEGKRYNTAVLLDREGKVAGCYPKVLVFWGEGLNPGEAGVKVVETSCSTVAAK
jgi:predicted amidohydrolase